MRLEDEVAGIIKLGQEEIIIADGHQCKRKGGLICIKAGVKDNQITMEGITTHTTLGHVGDMRKLDIYIDFVHKELKQIWWILIPFYGHLR